jgi:hypothetical protein
MNCFVMWHTTAMLLPVMIAVFFHLEQELMSDLVT